MSAIDWTAARSGIVAWVKAALPSIPADHVIWGYQSSDPFATPPPSVILGMAVERAAERGWPTTTEAAPDAPDGEELITTLRRQWVVHVVGEIRVANANVVGAAAPPDLVTHLLTHLRLPGTQLALQQAGLGLVDDAIGDGTPDLFKNVWQPRAQFAVAFHVTTQAQETAGYFDTAQVDTTVDSGDPRTVDLSLEATP